MTEGRYETKYSRSERNVMWTVAFVILLLVLIVWGLWYFNRANVGVTETTTITDTITPGVTDTGVVTDTATTGDTSAATSDNTGASTSETTGTTY